MSGKVLQEALVEFLPFLKLGHEDAPPGVEGLKWEEAEDPLEMEYCGGSAKGLNIVEKDILVGNVSKWKWADVLDGLNFFSGGENAEYLNVRKPGSEGCLAPPKCRKYSQKERRDIAKALLEEHKEKEHSHQNINYFKDKNPACVPLANLQKATYHPFMILLGYTSLVVGGAHRLVLRNIKGSTFSDSILCNRLSNVKGYTDAQVAGVILEWIKAKKSVKDLMKVLGKKLSKLTEFKQNDILFFVLNVILIQPVQNAYAVLFAVMGLHAIAKGEKDFAWFFKNFGKFPEGDITKLDFEDHEIVKGLKETDENLTVEEFWKNFK